MKEFFRKEREKMREMDFAEKRWYLWEYYKLHFAAAAIIIVLMVSITNAILNPSPDDYLYVVWLEVPATMWQLDGLAEELMVIVECPEGQTVTITDYSSVGDSQHDAALQTRFGALLHMGVLDVIITNRHEVYAFAEADFLRTPYEVKGYLSQLLHEDRLVFHEDEIIAVSLYGSPLLAQLGIPTDDAYLCVIVNTGRFGAIAKALEVLLYGA